MSVRMTSSRVRSIKRGGEESFGPFSAEWVVGVEAFRRIFCPTRGPQVPEKDGGQGTWDWDGRGIVFSWLADCTGQTKMREERRCQ